MAEKKLTLDELLAQATEFIADGNDEQAAWAAGVVHAHRNQDNSGTYNDILLDEYSRGYTALLVAKDQ